MSRGSFPAVLVAVLAVGCSDPSAPVGQVTGTARVAGKPKHDIQVRFYPDGAALGGLAEGLTDQTGRYTLYYTPAGEIDLRPGAVAGRYKVVLIDQSRPVPKDGGAMAPSAVPDRYGKPSTTPLAFEVKPGDNVFDVELK